MRLLRTPRVSPDTPPPPFPPYAATLFQLAYLATGSAERTDLLALAALERAHGEGASIQALAGLLASTDHELPASPAADEAGRPTQDRAVLLKRLEELSPLDRLALGLHIILGVPRGEIDQWLGIPGAAARTGAWIVETGDQLRLLPDGGAGNECRALAFDLVDADDNVRGREVRLHLLGCACCQARVEALRESLAALRRTLEALFPARLPQRAVVTRPRDQRNRQRRLQQLATIEVVAVVFLLLAFRPAPSDRSSAPQRITADELLDRALHRLEPGRFDGVLHERFRARTDTEDVLGERWISGSDPQRLRLVLKRGKDQGAMLDLVADGDRRMQWSAESTDNKTSGSVENRQVKALMPMLRVLPAGGTIGSFPSQHMSFDFALLGVARREGATLLGTTQTGGRAAYLLAYTDPAATRRVVLTIDAQTAALLRATASAVEGRSSAATLWETDLVELLPAAPAQIFQIASATSHELPEPRHLLLTPFSNMQDDNLARQFSAFPVPDQLPAGTALAYLRNADLFGAVQLYEGGWTTALILSPLVFVPSRPAPALDQRTGDTLWHVVRNDAKEDITIVDFAPADGSTIRSHLYLWHAYLTPEERQRAALEVIRSVRWLGSKELAAIGDRFVRAEQNIPHTYQDQSIQR